MNYLWAFVVGGAICVVGQLLIDYTKLSPARILHQLIKALCQRAFALFFAAHGGPGRQHRRVWEYYGIAPSYRHNRQSPFRFVWA